MTEKRFKICNAKTNWVGFDIKDNITGKKYYGGRLIQAEELCELLNKTHNENAILKDTVLYYQLLLKSLEEQAKRISNIHKEELK